MKKRILFGSVMAVTSFLPLISVVSCGSTQSQAMTDARVKVHVILNNAANKVSTIEELEKLFKVGVQDGFIQNVKIIKLVPNPNNTKFIQVYYSIKVPTNAEGTQFETCDDCVAIVKLAD